ncbi:MAG: (2,3-dihydroxybenzoyl)adenylate synthase [Solirubrobacteraceae bacterium]
MRTAGGTARLDGFTPWPRELAERYRHAGCWRGETLADVIDAAAQTRPDSVAIVDGSRRVTYRELVRRSRGVAAGLGALGIRRDDRVIVQMPSTLEFLDLTLALFRIGALPVMALPAHREHELAHLAAHAEAVAYAAPAQHRGFDHLAMGRALRDGSTTLRHLLVTEGEASPDAVALASLSEHVPLEDGDTGPGPEPGDVALFLLSGGTTGLPKLIPRTHDDYAYNARASAELCGLGPHTVYMVALPIGHNFPLACPGVLGTLMAGGRVVLSTDPGPEAAFPLIAAERVTATAVVPALAIRWLESPLRREADLSSLELLQVGGARLAPEVARRVRPELGCALQQVFGMAEGLLNFTRPDDPEEVVVDTQGRPLSPEDEIRIVDPLDEPVPPGQLGELQVRGPYTLRGYYRAEEHNARSFTPDGLYRSGDLVRLHPSGNLVVEGRVKDLINRGGEKISAEEIENLMLAHPGVLTCAAVAMPDPELGERTCAYAVPRGGAPLTLEALTTFLVERRIARYKLPERLEVVDELPLTKVGKVDKAALREDIVRKLEAEAAA